MSEIDAFTPSDEKRAWHRMRDESPKSYAAFRVYLELGEQRGIQRVATQLSKSRTLCSRWSSSHHWKERARAYDDFLSDVQMRTFISDRQAMARRQANVAVLGLNIAAQGLMQVQQALQAAGQVRPLKIHELARLLEVSARLERINRGEPDMDQVASIHVTISQQTEPRYKTFAGLREPKFDA